MSVPRNALAEMHARRLAALAGGVGWAPAEEGPGAEGSVAPRPSASGGSAQQRAAEDPSARGGGFVGLEPEAEPGPEQGVIRRVITRLAEEGRDLGPQQQAALVRTLVAAEAGGLARAQLEGIQQEVLQSLGGRLGPLQPLLDDPEVTEVMVNGPDQVYVERAGHLELTEVRFRDDRSVQALVERIVAPLGRSFSVAHPTVDARLRDGSRVNAVRPPVSLLGTTLTVRRFPRAFTLQGLVAAGAFGADCRWIDPDLDGPYPAQAPPWVALAWCVRHRRNLIVSGGTGSGKTTVLGALSAFIPASERVVFIEDAAELQPRLAHVVRLEARPPNPEGSGGVSIQHLVVNALRMRPDRIVVGEVRDIEALDMLLAMNTGHDGSLTTIHANSPREVFHRLLQATALRASGGLASSRDTIQDIAASALKVIVQVCRDGSQRRLDAIVAVEGLDGRGEPRLRDLYRWAGGHLRPTGEVPEWGESSDGAGVLA